MANYKTSRILPTVLVIIVIIIAIAGLVAVARALFFPGSSSNSGDQMVDISQQSLLSTSEGHAVRMAIRGPIVANENFRSYSITVSPTSREVKTYTGYLDTVLEEQTLSNNTAAYAEFVNALNRANLSKGTELEGERNDIQGICATGRLFQFSILKDGESVETLWTSTCGGSPGSLRASTEQLTRLFRAQIPNSSAMISKVGL